MANCNDLFFIFYKSISLSSKKKNELIAGRDALRTKIKKYFSDTLELPAPKFCGQGSFKMGTIINPLNKEYDLDDGIYLQHLNESNIYEWPTSETVHSWIKSAVDDHTKDGAIDKRTCIRVIYSGQYHIDLPIYGIYNDVYHLATKGEGGWTVSDPKKITDWFLSQVKQKGEQLRRIIKYIKAWSDIVANKHAMPSSLFLTILVCECYEENELDDVSLVDTLGKIYERLLGSFIVSNPVDLSENIGDNLSKQQKDNLLGDFVALLQTGSKALNEPNDTLASKLWREQFGDRFPIADPEIGKSFSSSLMDESHKELPKWPLNTLYKVHIDAHIYSEGKNKKLGSINSDGRRVSSGLWIRFIANTNTPTPYDVYWQVTNTGKHASLAKGLRGQIFKGDKGLIRWEQTSYTGKHWVECFIVKDGVCVARSNKFFVNIKNPDF